MPVDTFHIFDRKGKTLFTKQYKKDDKENDDEIDEEYLSERRKLVFGMLFSLKDITSSLTPEGSEKGLHTVRTGGSVLYNFETASGLKFALYTTSMPQSSDKAVREALNYVYNQLWMQCVIRSPLYNPIDPNVSATNFEKTLDGYFSSQPWFK